MRGTWAVYITMNNGSLFTQCEYIIGCIPGIERIYMQDVNDGRRTIGDGVCVLRLELPLGPTLSAGLPSALRRSRLHPVTPNTLQWTYCT